MGCSSGGWWGSLPGGSQVAMMNLDIVAMVQLGFLKLGRSLGVVGGNDIHQALKIDSWESFMQVIGWEKFSDLLEQVAPEAADQGNGSLGIEYDLDKIGFKNITRNQVCRRVL